MPNLHALSTKPWWRNIAPGSTVHYSTPQGQRGKGRVVMSLPTHLVLNIGGQHGTPKVVDDSNYIRHTTTRTRKPKS